MKISRCVLLFPVGILILLVGGVEAVSKAAPKSFCAAEEKAPDRASIDEAIRRGAEFLIRMQRVDGSWSGNKQNAPGFTALCSLALLKSGIGTDHQALVRAINYLSHNQPVQTYDTAVLCQLLECVDPETHRKWIELCAGQLVDTQTTGLWAYPRKPTMVRDMSNTQYAALGLRSASACGARVGRRVWDDLLNEVISWQCKDGGWPYRRSEKPKGSMTCAALTTILICIERLDGKGSAIAAKAEGALERGYAWLDRHFAVDKNPSPGREPEHYRWTYYYLYSVERLGTLAKKKRFGGRDWYSAGAAQLLKRQSKSNGDWGTAYGETEMNTSFALLFLTRATSSAYTLKERGSRVLSGKEGGKEIVIGCDWKNPGHVWIDSWSEGVADRFGIDGGKKAIRVKKVEYFVGRELLAEVTEDTTGGRITRYPFRYAFTENGLKEITAKVTCISANRTVSRVYESGKIKLLIHNNLSDRDRAYMKDVGRNLIRRNTPAVEVSSSWDGNWKGGRAVDGLHGTAWLSAAPEKDTAPWIELRFRKPVRADLLKLTHVYTYFYQKARRYGRAVRVLVLINGKSRKITADIGIEDGFKYEIPFKTIPVKKIRIEMLDRVKGSHEKPAQSGAAGFSEIELFSVSGK